MDDATRAVEKGQVTYSRNHKYLGLANFGHILIAVIEAGHGVEAVKDKFDERISASQKKAAFLQERERAFQQSKSLVASLSKDLLSKIRLPASLSQSFADKVINFKDNR